MSQLVLLRGTVGAGKTSVARRLIELRPDLRVIEVDRIKGANHGTTTISESADFIESGHLARKYLEAGHHTVLVEAFCNSPEITLSLKPTDRTIDLDSVEFVWLECSLETALRRKKQALKPVEIIGQFSRYANRYSHPNELTVKTDSLSVDEVAQQILSRIPLE